MSAETTSLPGGKLTLVFRIEPGCLGPDGKDYIEEFCLLVQKAFEQTHQRTVVLEIIPRFDKQLPETEYRLGERGLSKKGKKPRACWRRWVKISMPWKVSSMTPCRI